MRVRQKIQQAISLARGNFDQLSDQDQETLKKYNVSVKSLMQPGLCSVQADTEAEREMYRELQSIARKLGSKKIFVCLTSDDMQL